MARNFAPEDQALGKHVSAEHDSTREAVEAEGEATRSELREIRTHLLQQGEKQSAIRQERAKLAAKRNEAFSRRVETGGGTQLEEKKFRLKILAAEIKQEEAQEQLKKAKAQLASKSAPPTKRRLLGAPPPEVAANESEEADGSEVALATFEQWFQHSAA